MTDESQSYNLNTLRELLTGAFDPVELRALIAYDDRLKGLALEFALADPITVMADKAIAWCDRRGVIGYLADRVKVERPDKVKDFEASLYRAGAPLPSRDAAAEAAEQAAQRERERQEREDAERRKAELEDLYGQAAGRLRERDWAGACDALAQIQEIEPGYRNTLALLRQAETEQARSEQVDALMAQGMGHLKEGKWWLANQAFRQVLALAPDHAEARARLAEADSQEQIAGRLVAGQNDLRAGLWSEAVADFQAVLQMQPGHQEATKLLAEAQVQERARLEEKAREAERDRKEAAERARREAEARQAEVARQEAAELAKREEEARQAELFRLYCVACLAAYARNWPMAIIGFTSVLGMDLNYRDAAARLKEARTLQSVDQEVGGNRWLFPREGPRPPDDVLRVQRQIQTAGTAQSPKGSPGQPAKAKQAGWRTVADLHAYSCDVDRAAFSPDGKRLVTAGTGDGDKKARVFEIATGKLVTELLGHTDSVLCAAFSPDGKLVVTASGDGRARLWQAATGKVVTELRVHAKIFRAGWYSVLSAAFSPDGSLVATASGDGKVRLWAAATGELVAEVGGGDQSACRVDFGPDGGSLITPDKDGTARIREVQTGKIVAELRGHTQKLRDAAFSADGTRAATAGEDGTVRIWEVATGNTVRELTVHKYKPVWTVAFHPSGKWVVTAALTENALVWEVATGKVVAKLRGSSGYSVSSAAFSPDGKWAATAGVGARIWEVPQG